MDSKGEVIAIRCPRCGNEQRGGTHCNRCGLEFARWRGVETLLDEITDPDLRKIVHKLWSELEEDFTNEKRHEEFLEFCRINETLEVAASLYRVWLVEHPEDEIAKRQQTRIVTYAQQVLDTARQREERRAARIAKVVGYVITALIAGFVLYASWWIIQNLPRLFSR